MPDGLVFDLVYLPGERGLTGHLDGVVTLDLAEADPVHRDDLRRQLGEPFRTLIGSFRHEVGHHYWRSLVERRGGLAPFRAVFGDERADYDAALRRYYATADAAWDEHRYVSRYAQSHPHEDWAETFAHYLHIVDLVDTAAAHGLIDIGSPTANDILPVPAGASITDLLDAVAPDRPRRRRPRRQHRRRAPLPGRRRPGPWSDKLAHVHDCVTAAHDPPTR